MEMQAEMTIENGFGNDLNIKSCNNEASNFENIRGFATPKVTILAETDDILSLNESRESCQEDVANNNLEENRSTANVMILYKKQLATKQIFSIKLDEIDEYDFKNCMFEILEKPKYVHLYFDLDCIINEEQLKSVLDVLDSYKSVFGRYVYGGYARDQNIAEKYSLRYINDVNANIVHEISIHAVYPETMILSSDLMKIMKYKDKRFINEGLSGLFDPSVYKLSSHQLFWHVLSNKIYTPSDEKNRYNAGYIALGTKPSEFIINVRGDEKIVDESSWSKLFKINEKCDSKFDSKYDVNAEENKANIDDSEKEDIDFTAMFVKAKNQTNHIQITKDIFDALVKGFNKEIQIHCTSEDKVKNEVSILPLICALNAYVNDHSNDDLSDSSKADDVIAKSSVDEALEFIRQNATLTENASRRWFEIIYRNKEKKEDHPGALFTIIKTFRPNYYESNIKPLIRKQLKGINSDSFENERYTINEYKSDCIRFRSYDEYINGLVKCLAFIDDGRYVIKIKDEIHMKHDFQIIDEKSLKEKLRFVGVYYTKASEEDIMKRRSQHRKLPESNVMIKKPFKPLIELLKIDVQARFKHYTSSALIVSCKRVFNLFRPPNPNDYYVDIIRYNELNPSSFVQDSLVKAFLKLIKDQLYDEEAMISFDHFIKTNAYLLQYRKKSNVFFIKYSETGNTGKNYIDNAFKYLYNEYALTGITEAQITEKYNGGFANKLYRAYDEFETSNYKTKSINNILKRITNDKVTTRSMCTDTKQTYDYAIDVLNTNDSACYGIIKGDKATISRLCIIRMKERDIRCSQFCSYINVIDDISFPYQLYNYLMSIDLTDFVNEKRYNRYPLDRTQSIIKQFNSLKSNSLDEFIESIYDQFEQKIYKSSQVDVIRSADLNRLYKAFMADRRYALSTSLRDELERRGLHYIRRMKFRGIAQEVYYRSHVEEDKEYECFDDDNESPI